MLKIFEGKKTYIVAALLLACVAAEKLLGVDIPGFDATQDWFRVVLEAAGISTLRAAVAKV